MKEKGFIKVFNALLNLTIGLLSLLILLVAVFILGHWQPDLFRADGDREQLTVIDEPQQTTTDQGEFLEGEHRLLVIANCTGCHSAKLVTQNRATREGWRSMIRWMQETQNLKELGADEEKILDYLSENYAPEPQGRRQNLLVEDWYELD